MWQPIEITRIKETENNTFLEVATQFSKEDILKYSTTDGLFAVIKFFDTRRITDNQRKKIFATCKDIAEHQGDPSELVRYELIGSFCEETGQEYFSLSDCSLENARELINYIIEYVIMHDIPLTQLAIERTEDIGQYLFYCLKHSKCCCCGMQGIIYTLDKEKNKICLCNTHYDMAKAKGLKEFEKAWKVYGVKYVG